MRHISKETLYQGGIPLIFISIITILSWPNYQNVLGSNGVFIALLSFLPVLALNYISKNKVLTIVSQFAVFSICYLTFYFGLKHVDWSKSYFQFIHATVLSISLFLNFAFIKRDSTEVTKVIKNFFVPFFPVLFITFFLFWFLKSSQGIVFSFDTLWFFISLFVCLMTYFQTFSPTNEIKDTFFLKTLFYFVGFLLIITVIWFIRAQFNIQPGESKLFWSASLFLVLATIANGFNQEFKNNKLGKVISIVIILLSSTQLILSSIELNKYGALESRYFHFYISLISLSSFIFNFIKFNFKFALKLNLLNFLLIISFIGPLNIYDLSFKSQKQILWQVFEKNKMTKEDKVIRSTSEVSNADRLKISSITHYIYHNHDIHLLQPWFNFDIKNVFKSTTPFIMTADFDKDMANIKGLLNYIGLDYTVHQNRSQRTKQVKRISFHLNRLKGESNTVNINGYKDIIKDYGRPLSIQTKIKDQNVNFILNKSDMVLETTINNKVVHRVNFLNKYRPFLSIDEKQRHMNFDIHPNDIDIEFSTYLFNVKFVINRIQGHYENGSIHINHIDALCLLSY